MLFQRNLLTNYLITNAIGFGNMFISKIVHFSFFQAFCLASFAYNDKALKKLMENFGCYSDKLQEDKVYEAFITIIAQSKKLPKTENKVILDELSAKIEEERAKQVRHSNIIKQNTIPCYNLLQVSKNMIFLG